MAVPESNVHSFIVKLWLEAADGKADQANWHGHVTHVSSGERQYIKSPREIERIVTPYLQAEGYRPGWRWRVRQWWRGW